MKVWFYGGLKAQPYSFLPIFIGKHNRKMMWGKKIDRFNLNGVVRDYTIQIFNYFSSSKKVKIPSFSKGLAISFTACASYPSSFKRSITGG